MCENKGIFGKKVLSILSCAAALVIGIPAWGQGVCLTAVVIAALSILLWRTNLYRLWPDSGPAAQGYLAAGLLCSGCVGVNFYNNWSSFAPVAAVVQRIGLPYLVPLLSAVLAVAAAPAFAAVLGFYCHTALEDYREMSRKAPGDSRGIPAEKAFCLLLLVYVVGASAILRTNFYYQDDVSRAVYGYKQWDYFGRFLSTALATFVHSGDFLTDIAPLPQLLALGIMALSGIILLSVFCNRTRFSLWELIAVVPLALNPYFLECLSFRFDAVYMAVSVLAGIAPLLYRKRGGWQYVFAAMLGTLAICTSYQSATGIFPVLVILLAVGLWNQGGSFRDSVGFCLRSAAGYGLGLVYFKLVLMRPADAGYVSNAMPSLNRLLPTMVENLKRYYHYVLTDMKSWWLVLILLIGVLFLGVMIHSSRQKRWLSALVSTLALGAMAALCFGLYLALETPLFAPRAMYGFGVLIVALNITVCRNQRFSWKKLPTVVLAWAFFVFSFTYGNALNVQKEYTEFRIQLVIQDLNRLDILDTEETVTLRILGSIGQAPALDQYPRDGGILRRLIPETFSGGDDLTQYRFFCYYGLPNVQRGTEENCTEQELPLLEDTLYHAIYGEGNQVLVELK